MCFLLQKWKAKPSSRSVNHIIWKTCHHRWIKRERENVSIECIKIQMARKRLAKIFNTIVRTSSSMAAIVSHVFFVHRACMHFLLVHSIYRLQKTNATETNQWKNHTFKYIKSATTASKEKHYWITTKTNKTSFRT